MYVYSCYRLNFAVFKKLKAALTRERDKKGVTKKYHGCVKLEKVH